MGKFIDFLREECIVPNANFSNKNEVLKAIVTHAKKSSVLDEIPEDELYNAFLNREKIGSTGFEDGIAIPHCRLKNVKEFVIGIITVPDGVDFDAIDGNDSNIIFYIVGPESGTTEHIRLLSAISRVCRIPNAVKELLAETSPEAMKESFFRFLNDEIETDEDVSKCLFHIGVSAKDIFQEILQLFTSMEASTVFVVEAKQPQDFLTEMPLFMGFWDDTADNPWQLIIATVDKKLANETIRKLEGICGKLNSRNDIFVTVQELFYCAGKIKA